MKDWNAEKVLFPDNWISYTQARDRRRVSPGEDIGGGAAGADPGD
jgi:hypothetical protein